MELGVSAVWCGSQPLDSCTTLAKLGNLFIPRFPHLQVGDKRDPVSFAQSQRHRAAICLARAHVVFAKPWGL